jgi:hypothetical protein
VSATAVVIGGDIVRLLERRTIHRIDPKTARAAWRAFRVENGYGPDAPLLSPPDSNVKLDKTQHADQYAVVYGLSLSPAGVSGYQVCRYRTAACEAGCVATSGKGGLPAVMAARSLKARFLVHNTSAFVSLLDAEIAAAKRKHGPDLAVRLNTFSDIPWERIVPWLFTVHSDVAFYDYTKWSGRIPPPNYSLTRSCSERMSDAMVAELVTGGQNVAVVFATARTRDLPTTWHGLRVIDGDKTDARHLDERGVVVGLRAKGTMRRNPMGMVRSI